ncbi:hypothetical protein [Microbacterium sp. PA5]|uniref:hypothetical protein n=1 Tax=Microbacterium sp. PA5 TaxID=3416654 RepID=UPI003CEB2076
MTDSEMLTEARAILLRTRDELGAIRSRVPGLEAATRWRSRAADEFADALGEWTRSLRRIDDELDRWEAALAAAQARAAGSTGASG